MALVVSSLQDITIYIILYCACNIIYNRKQSFHLNCLKSSRKEKYFSLWLHKCKDKLWSRMYSMSGTVLKEALFNQWFYLIEVILFCIKMQGYKIHPWRIWCDREWILWPCDSEAVLCWKGNFHWSKDLEWSCELWLNFTQTLSYHPWESSRDNGLMKGGKGKKGKK